MPPVGTGRDCGGARSVGITGTRALASSPSPWARSTSYGRISVVARAPVRAAARMGGRLASVSGAAESGGTPVRATTVPSRSAKPTKSNVPLARMVSR